MWFVPKSFPYTLEFYSEKHLEINYLKNCSDRRVKIKFLVIKQTWPTPSLITNKTSHWLGPKVLTNAYDPA